MGNCVNFVAALAACLLSAACSTVPESPPARASLAITNVTVIDPQSRRVLAGQSIYIDGGTIVAIQPVSDRSFIADRSIDATGKFLIPGLMDMHVHLFLPEPAKPTLNLLLANGITGIREMSSDCWAVVGVKKGCVEDYRQLQLGIARGDIAGPDLLALTSTMVFGPSRLKLPESAPSFITPRSEAEARSLVDYLRQRGIDLIKTHDSIPAAAFATLMDQANRAGIAVGGHVPFAAGSVGAAQMGYRSIEHARDILYDCSRYGAEYRRQESLVADGVAGAERPASIDRLSRTVSDFDPALCGTTLDQLASSGVYYVPTHVTREMEARARDPSYRDDPAREYVLPKRNSDWEEDLRETAALPDEEVEALGRFFRHGIRITGLAHAAGVPVMAGTDSNDTMIVPGFSLHRELGLLREAGLSTMDVLRSATTIPAAYLGQSERLGGIGVGKEADLVLLERNPLDDIANSRTVAAVVSNGRLFDRAALDGLLAEVGAVAKAGAPSP